MMLSSVQKLKNGKMMFSAQVEGQQGRI